MEKVLARYGGDITRTTMANWIIRLSVTLQPLLDRLDSQLMSCNYLHIDETRLQVLKELGMTPTGDKWIWVMRGGPPGRQVVLFNYDKSRGGGVVIRLLENFTGDYVQTDGYAAYDKPCAALGVVHLGCMDHGRRKVVEAIKTQDKALKGKAHKGKPSVAMVLLSHIDALYRFERQWADLDDDERYEQRQKIAVPRLAKIKQWLDDKQPKVAPDTLTRGAINYLINQWDHLVRYCEHGQLRISNVLAENAIRPFAVGRRAWLFSDTPEGANASAAMFSLIETALCRMRQRQTDSNPMRTCNGLSIISPLRTRMRRLMLSCRGIWHRGSLKRQVPCYVGAYDSVANLVLICLAGKQSITQYSLPSTTAQC